MRVYIVGMSNTQAVKQALPLYKGRTDYSVEYLHNKDRAPWEIKQATLRPEYFGDNLNADIVLSMLFGGWHLSLAMVEHPIPFDFEVPWDDAPPLPSRHVVPYNQIFSVVDPYIRRQFGPLVGLRKLVRTRLLHLEPQPPIPSEAHLRRFPGPFATAMKANGIAPLSVRLKAWKLQNLVIRNLCEEIGVEYLPFPEECKGPDGALREDLWQIDPGHANKVYGEMVLERIDALAVECEA